MVIVDVVELEVPNSIELHGEEVVGEVADIVGIHEA